MLERVSTC